MGQAVSPDLPHGQAILDRFASNSIRFPIPIFHLPYGCSTTSA